MKTIGRNKAVLLLTVALSMLAHSSYAGIAEKFDKYILSEFTNLTGLYIIFGVLIAGVIGKIIQYFWMKNAEQVSQNQTIRYNNYRRQRHYHRPVVKKTS